MSERRINTETGVIEEKSGLSGLFDIWSPARNENGNEERINTGTGVIEEKSGLSGLFDIWSPKS